ncbi:MAG: hypothetical protein E6Q97_16915 [Desulfurellales bacterium]|nr:MAG: hypothetical protein E6Q97_16915 [Desulfurellales bacterium]
MEVVSTDEPIPTYEAVSIASISQTTTILTVTTATKHGLSVGDSIQIYGVSDSRCNYPAVVVASTPTPTQFTVTAGPMGTITSLTMGPYTSGFVAKRSRLGYAKSGISQIFENTTATNASLYIRADAGAEYPSGTLGGSHIVTVGSSASVQAVNSAYNYAFTPTTEYRMTLFSDRVQWTDSLLDTTAQSTNRLSRSQLIPNNGKKHTVRFRGMNSRALTVPVGRIISATKTGTTTATVVTDVPHGLGLADLVVMYGCSDQTNFANLTVATSVASIIDAYTFTIVWGAAVTATGYGGLVARVNGGNLGSALGYNAVVAVSATLATAADGKRALTLTGNTTWAGLLVGDYVNVHGLRNNTNGGDLGCDGSWKVRSVATTILELEPIGSTVPPANFGATGCGGAIIKRADMRISFVRMYDFDRLRVEMLSRPSTDLASAMPVAVQGGLLSAAQSGTWLAYPAIAAAAATGVALTPQRLISAATTNSTLVKSTAGRLAAGVVSNTSATIKYFKLYNKATAPTIGTDTPVFTIPIPPTSTIPLAEIVGIYGHSFSLGIGYGITGAFADADTTAVAAGDVIVNLMYI